jgi:uncharacterized protein (TIGR03435 family)
MKPWAVLLLLPAALSFGQTAPAFDVASVKLSKSEPNSGSGVTTDKGRVTARNVTLKRCMRAAYDVPEPQILGGPKWIEDDRYDIDAKATGPAGDQELMAMLQSLLAERFKLVFHRETKALSGYALIVAKTGLTAKPSAPDAPSRSTSSRGSIDAEGCTMAQLAMKLSEALHLPVADLTAVKGAFDFQITWTPEDLQAKPSAAPAVPGVSLFAALEEQLGLKLEARKVPTLVLVIDSADKASEN